jgi:hypothetical protein
MIEQSPYDRLGISVDASFEEVQAARDRLLAEVQGDQKQAEVIETAYDSVLMERLRMRQEGKIKVPERIRFPERVDEPAPSKTFSLPSVNVSPSWIQRTLDTPSRTDVMWTTLAFSGLGGLSLFYPSRSSEGVLQLTLALGIGFSLYFLNRKENKFGRSLVLSLLGLVVGLILGSFVVPSLFAHVQITQFNPQQLIAAITFLVLWLVSSFLR